MKEKLKSQFRDRVSQGENPADVMAELGQKNSFEIGLTESDLFDMAMEYWENIKGEYSD